MPIANTCSIGYPHDSRADNAAYRHDRRADNAAYRHDRRADSLSLYHVPINYVLSEGFFLDRLSQHRHDGCANKVGSQDIDG